MEARLIETIKKTKEDFLKLQESIPYSSKAKEIDSRLAKERKILGLFGKIEDMAGKIMREQK